MSEVAYMSLVSVRRTNSDTVKKDGTFYTANKNEVFPLRVTASAGQIPGKCLVLDGTVAETNGVEEGKMYLQISTLTFVDAKYGEQYTSTFTPVTSPLEIIKMVKELGAATVVDTRTTIPDPSVAKPAMAGALANDPITGS